MSKTYLGDSVYAVSDGYGVILTTENGLPSDPSNTIYLERPVIEALVNYAIAEKVILAPESGADAGRLAPDAS